MQFFIQSTVTSGVSAVVGGTMAEIQGGDFWRAAGDSAMWAAAGFVLTSSIVESLKNDNSYGAGEGDSNEVDKAKKKKLYYGQEKKGSCGPTSARNSGIFLFGEKVLKKLGFGTEEAFRNLHKNDWDKKGCTHEQLKKILDRFLKLINKNKEFKVATHSAILGGYKMATFMRRDGYLCFISGATPGHWILVIGSTPTGNGKGFVTYVDSWPMKGYKPSVGVRVQAKTTSYEQWDNKKLRYSVGIMPR